MRQMFEYSFHQINQSINHNSVVFSKVEMDSLLNVHYSGRNPYKPFAFSAQHMNK